jgi:hypothetical protein
METQVLLSLTKPLTHFMVMPCFYTACTFLKPTALAPYVMQFPYLSPNVTTYYSGLHLAWLQACFTAIKKAPLGAFLMRG